MKNIFVVAFILSSTSMVFLYFFSYSTSPLYNLWGFDSAIFMTVGKSMAVGKKLYSDIFDHKGPFLFLIEYIGWSIYGKTGIFLLQITNLTIALYVAYKIWLQFGFSSKSTPIPIIGLLLLLHFSNNEGNQSEEYCLIFLFIPLLYGIKYLIAENTVKHPPLYSLMYGLCFAVIAFNRITNGVPIAAMCLGISIFLIMNKEWKNLFQNIGYLSLGCLIVSASTCLYFYLSGRLYDMLYATFVFNFKYSSTVGGGSFENLFTVNRKHLLWFILKITPAFLLLITSTIYFIKQKNLKLFISGICISFFTYWSINMGLRGGHYMTINAIPLILGLAIMYKLFYSKEIKVNIITKLALAVYTLCMFASFLYIGKIIVLAYSSSSKPDENNPGFYYHIDKRLVSDLIKGEDKKSVFGYNLNPTWYLETDMVPPYKYFTNQEAWIRSDSMIYFEIKKYLINTPPKWIVIPSPRTTEWLMGVKGNPVLEKIIEQNYILEGSDINHLYYRHKGNNQ